MHDKIWQILSEWWRTFFLKCVGERSQLTWNFFGVGLISEDVFKHSLFGGTGTFIEMNLVQYGFGDIALDCHMNLERKFSVSIFGETNHLELLMCSDHQM